MSTRAPLPWCITCQHTHIRAIPAVTFLCRGDDDGPCGWGQWTEADAAAHREACPGHQTYPVRHTLVPVDQTITVPKPHVPYGPKGVDPDQATADYLRTAAERIRQARYFGSNLTATLVALIDAAAAAVEPEQQQPECTCAMTEGSMRRCPRHGEGAEA